ncbi:hypothetical protein ACFQ4N_04735 [Oceanobacillus iheyensis]|uniref:Hypothetical conserved protein n=2 Tax=Oceanobacillus iheyensis TaxID=182710 RepID=Q8CV60_OCEIH|nr:hypothetical conserved protein [Oceanobacillus iheyensis HTE831]
MYFIITQNIIVIPKEEIPIKLQRDFSELSMMSKTDWEDGELQYFQYALSQILPYINSEGLSVLHEINKEMFQRIEKKSGHPLG